MCAYCDVCRLSDELTGSMSSSLTLVTALDEDTDTTSVSTPHAVQPPQSSVTDSAPADPVSLLPTAVSELFPSSVPEVASTDSFADMVEDGVGDLISADDGYRRVRSVPQNSESSGGSSEGAVELSEILDSAQRSDDLNADSQP